MILFDLCELPIGMLASQNCYLFLFEDVEADPFISSWAPKL